MAEYPYVPETITVHLGRPDEPAPNVTVPFLEYIQNVASSELYPTWPENALRANIYAQTSFALNRIFTEWYPSRGYDFDITNSTAFDQAFVYGRDIFDNISDLVNELFAQYLARPGFVQPLFAAYCDGRRVQCEGLSQWGTVELARQGMTPYEILTYYYGDELEIRSAPIRPLMRSYPGVPLRLGDINVSVEIIQDRLNRIARNYPTIPRIADTDGVFDLETQNAVQAFQNIFSLTPDGIVGPATWYQITSVYNAVLRLAELDAEGLRPEDVERRLPRVLREGMRGDMVRLLQFLLDQISIYNSALPRVDIDGIFGPDTRDAVREFQQENDLETDGIVGINTWNAIINAYNQIERIQSANGGTVILPPPNALVLGSRSEDVSRLQGWLNRIADFYPEIPVVPRTGYYGEMTRQAVMTYQELFGYPVTGYTTPLLFYQIELTANQLDNPQL
ncbi:MAG TPA: spore cortex-lytic protein [Clostridiales bacterium]|nr:spore cortex-lytic protein [Clostridiales bacterium]